MLILITVIYSFTLWMGCYLLRRDATQIAMRYAGFGLIAYAIGLLLIYLLSSTSQLFGLQAFASVIPLLCWAISIHAYMQDFSDAPRISWWMLIVGSIFFGLGLALLFLPQSFITADIVLLAIAFDLVLVGYAIAKLHTHLQGEALLPDAIRSLMSVSIAVLIVGSQILVVMTIQNDDTVIMQALLFSLLTMLIVTLVFGYSITQWFDRLVFSQSSDLQQERAELQAIADALPRRDMNLKVTTLLDDEKEFTRLTRRALSHLSNLNRLVSSPLISLPVVDAYITEQKLPHEQSLDRARALQQILIKSIERLKPTTDSEITSDVMRYYNALYYPYVRGIKPFSTRQILSDFDDETHQIIQWFQTQVPERTLYNWQNVAAELIAKDLLEQMK